MIFTPNSIEIKDVPGNFIVSDIPANIIKRLGIKQDTNFSA